MSVVTGICFILAASGIMQSIVAMHLNKRIATLEEQVSRKSKKGGK